MRNVHSTFGRKTPKADQTDEHQTGLLSRRKHHTTISHLGQATVSEQGVFGSTQTNGGKSNWEDKK